MFRKILSVFIIVMTIFICVACNTTNTTNGEITLGTKTYSTEKIQTTEVETTVATTTTEQIVPVETTVYTPTPDDKTLERYPLSVSLYADEYEDPNPNSEKTYKSYSPYLFNASMHEYDIKTNSHLENTGLASLYLNTGDTEYLLNKSNPIAAVNFAPTIEAQSKLILRYDNKSVAGQMFVYEDGSTEKNVFDITNNEFDISTLESGKEYICAIEFAHRGYTVFFGNGSTVNGKLDMYYLVIKLKVV